VFMHDDTTGEIAARRELPSLVQILSTSRRTTGLNVDRSITRKIASGCNGSVAPAGDSRQRSIGRHASIDVWPSQLYLETGRSRRGLADATTTGTRPRP